MKTSNNYLKSIEILAFVIVITIFLFNSSCSNSTDPAANEVFIQNMTFTPTTLTVKSGTTVKWTNKDGVGHTVTSDTGLFDSGNLSTNGVFSYMFTTIGTFNYHCSVHPSMTAKIIVN